jgi:hypothetical protein
MSVLDILFREDLLKCIPLLYSELIGVEVVASGPISETFHQVGDVIGVFKVPEPSLSDSNPFELD